MARRHHATMQKLDTLREQVKGYAHKGASLLETGAGAYAGGLIEGRYGGAALGPLPYNLLTGVGFLIAGYMNPGGHGKHLENIGNGFVASYTSALGYAFGKRWRETGTAFGGGGNPWLSPYENGWPKKNLGAAAAAPTAAGQWPTTDPTPAQMAAIAQQMQAAANSPAY